MRVSSRRVSCRPGASSRNLLCDSKEACVTVLNMNSTPQKSSYSGDQESVLTGVRSHERPSNRNDSALKGAANTGSGDFDRADSLNNSGTEEGMSLLDSTLSSSIIMPSGDIGPDEKNTRSVCIQREADHFNPSCVALQAESVAYDKSQEYCLSKRHIDSSSCHSLMNTSDSCVFSHVNTDQKDGNSMMKDAQSILTRKLKDKDAKTHLEKCTTELMATIHSQNAQIKSSCNSAQVQNLEKGRELLLESPGTTKPMKSVITSSTERIYCVTPRAKDFRTNHIAQSSSSANAELHMHKPVYQISNPLPGVGSPLTPAERVRRRGFITPERSMQTDVNFTPLRPFSLFYTCQPEARGHTVKQDPGSEIHAVMFKTPSAFLKHQARVLGSHKRDYIYRQQQQQDGQQEKREQDNVFHNNSENPKLYDDDLATRYTDLSERHGKLENGGNTVEFVCGDSGSKRTPTSRFLARSISAAPAPGYCNPFERGLIESLHGPINFSPNLFKTSTPGSKAPPTFQWSIDEIAMLKPADIDETEDTQTDIWTTGLNAEIEEQAQQAIDTYFSSNIIVPSPWTDSTERKKSFHLPTTPGYVASDSPMVFSIVKSMMKNGTPLSTATPATTGLEAASQRSEVQKVLSGGGGDNQLSGKTKAASVQTTVSFPVDFDLQSCLPDHCLHLSSNPTSPLIAGGPGTKIMVGQRPVSRKKKRGGHRQRAKDVEAAAVAAAREDSLTALNNSSLPRKLFFTGTAPSPVRSSSLSADGSTSRDAEQDIIGAEIIKENTNVNSSMMNSSLEEKLSLSGRKSLTNMSPIRRCSTVPLLFNSPGLSPVRSTVKRSSFNLDNSGLDLNNFHELDSPDESSIGSESSSLSDDVCGSGNNSGVDSDYRIGDSLVLPNRLVESHSESHIEVASGTRSRLMFEDPCSPLQPFIADSSARWQELADQQHPAAVTSHSKPCDSPGIKGQGGRDKELSSPPDGAARELARQKSQASSTSSTTASLHFSLVQHSVSPSSCACADTCHDSPEVLSTEEKITGSEASEERLRMPDTLLQNSRLALAPLLFHADDLHEPSEFRNCLSDEGLASAESNLLGGIVYSQSVGNTNLRCSVEDRKKVEEENGIIQNSSAQYMEESGDISLDSSNASTTESQMSVYVDSQEFILPGITYQQSESGDTGYQSSSLLNLQSTNGSVAISSNANSFNSKSVPYTICSISSVPVGSSNSFHIFAQVDSTDGRSRSVANSCTNDAQAMISNNDMCVGVKPFNKFAHAYTDCSMPSATVGSCNEEAQFVLLSSERGELLEAVESRDVNMSLDFSGAFI